MTALDETSLLRTMQLHFGHTGFRQGQLEIVRSILSGRPTLAVMPTGAGKSLCYQLPSLLLPGVTLVVSPLVALMKDQVDQLIRRRIPAAYVNSTQPEGERAVTERLLAQGEYKLLYVAPERFRSPSFRRAIAQVQVSLLAIDEAHCISEWGSSFRPDYERLGDVLGELGSARILALTATATRDVRQDIIRSLRLKAPAIIATGFDRPNIGIEVHPLRTDPEKKDTLVAAVRNLQPAIVYSATRRLAASFARLLNTHQIRAAPYHAGLDPQERTWTQERFMRGELDVVTATNAFGLGVDKKDVRLVVHTEIPRSIEAYYQEIGRAGRDGREAVAALLFVPKDVFFIRHLFNIMTPPPEFVELLAARLADAREPVPFPELLRQLPERPVAQQLNAALAFLESLGCVERKSTLDASGEKTNLYCGVADNPLAREDLDRLRHRSFRDRQRLERMVRFAQQRTCRRMALLRELGEPANRSECGACDVCADPRLVPVRSRLEPRGQSAWAMSVSAGKVPASQASRASGSHAGH
jgi:ATP-dependent DNA helicase RecQ